MNLKKKPAKYQYIPRIYKPVYPIILVITPNISKTYISSDIHNVEYLSITENSVQLQTFDIFGFLVKI